MPYKNGLKTAIELSVEDTLIDDHHSDTRVIAARVLLAVAISKGLEISGKDRKRLRRVLHDSGIEFVWNDLRL